MDIIQLIKAFITSSIIAAVTTPIVILVYKKFGWLDNPAKRKHPKVVHQYPVPRGGGMVIFLAIVSASIIFLPLDKHLVGILLGIAILAIVGTLDDIFDLNPYLRLGLGLLASLCVVGAGIGIAFITNPLGGVIRLDQPQIPIFLFGKTRNLWILADIFAILWILACANFVNWSKGVDGQLPGIVVIASLTIAILSFRFSADITQWPVAVLAFITAGAYAGFLPFNFYPQKIMPGYGGGTIAGFILAVLSILATTKVGTAIMVLGVPLVDAGFAILRRIAQGRSPVWGDAGHLHHRLLQIGWGKRRIAFFYWLATFLLGILALQLSSRAKLYTIGLITFILGGFFLWARILNSSLFPQDQSSG